MDKKHVVSKANSLVVSNFDLSVIEQKIIMTVASMVNPYDDEFKDYEFKIQDFKQLMKSKNKNIYTELKPIAKEIMKKPFEIHDVTKGEIVITNWFSTITYLDGEGIIIFRFDPKLKPYMLQLKGVYTRYKLGNVLSLKSKYSLRMYELLKANSFKKEWLIDIDEFRKLIGANEKSYNIYQNLKAKVIEKTQRELAEKTDIRFTFSEIKRGNRNVKLLFVIEEDENSEYAMPKKNKIVEVEPAEIEVETPVEEVEIPVETQVFKSSDMILDNLKELRNHFNEKQILEFYKASGEDKDKLKAIYFHSIYMAPNNLVGYMMKLLKDGFDKPIKIGGKSGASKAKKDFTEREYDFDALERKLLGWDK